MKKFLIVIALTVLSGAVFYLHAQEFKDGRVAVTGKFPQYQRQFFTKEDGLGEDKVVDISFDTKGTMWVFTAGGVSFYDGKKFKAVTSEADVANLARNFEFDTSLFTMWRGDEIKKEELEAKLKGGLPYDKINVMTKSASGEIYYGTPEGLILERGGKFKYYWGKRWIPDNNVNAVAVDKNGAIWAGTNAGLVKIYPTQMSLEEKAAYFNKHIQTRHVRDGFIRFLVVNENFLTHADNDGLWTSLYVAAESFRYAVTKDAIAKKNAKKSFDALEWLETITGNLGFPARSIVPKGEPEKRKYGGEWHVDKTGKWEWKGDTSSDELVGHFYAYSLYYDLVADAKEKKRVAALASRICNHLIDHEYYLVDLDGKPTSWGIYNASYPKWMALKGLNSLEILSHFKTCSHMTGDKKFEVAYDFLVGKGYAKNALRQKITLSTNHSDDEHAILAYYPLIKYEKNPELLEMYKKSLKRSWDIDKPEHNPWYNFTYCAFMDGDCDIANSVATLVEIPLDQREWQTKNSHRLDCGFEKGLYGRFGELECDHALPYDERAFLRWNGNPYRVDGGGDGNEEGDGVLYYLPYWMGRYLGFIKEK